MQRQYRRDELEKSSEKQKAAISPSQKEVIEFLNRVEVGDIWGFADLVLAIIHRPSGTGPYEAQDASLINWIGWKSLDSTVQIKVLWGALKYLTEANPETSQLLGTHPYFSC